uniref:Uncharacterized protein n=1 Tax=Panagrolaimus superbus TaxID=310955 RepID=A0A914YFK8_9BILA
MAHRDGDNVTRLVANNSITVLKDAKFSKLYIQHLDPKPEEIFNIHVDKSGSLKADYVEVDCIRKEMFMEFNGKVDLQLINVLGNLQGLH